MVLGAVLVTLDFFVVSLALPDVARELGADTSELTWTVTGYLLATAVTLAVAGALGDRYGRRRTLLVGLAVFTASSLVAIVASDPVVLIVARTLQGLGGAILVPLSLAIVSAAHTGSQRARAVGIWVAAGAAGSALGPLVGGLITELLSWRWIFVPNVVGGIAVGALTLRAVAVDEGDDSGRLDVGGIVLLVAGFGALVIALQQGERWGWSAAATLACAGIGAIALVGFVARERRAAPALFDPDLVRRPGFAAAGAIGFLVNAARGALVVLLSLWLASVAGLAPLASGLVMTPLAAAVAATGSLAGSLAARGMGRPAAVLGALAMTVSFAVLAAATEATPVGLLVAVLAISGVGFSFAYTVTTTAAITASPEHEAGAASGAISAIRAAGATVGIAAGTAIETAVARLRLDDLVGAVDAASVPSADLAAGGAAAREALVGMPGIDRGEAARVVADAASAGFSAAMILCLAISLLAAVVAARSLGPAPDARQPPPLTPASGRGPGPT